VNVLLLTFARVEIIVSFASVNCGSCWEHDPSYLYAVAERDLEDGNFSFVLILPLRRK
jgi:hypothetical protein